MAKRSSTNATTYRIRLMAGLASSLVLVIIATRIPFETVPGRVGWRSTSAPQRMFFQVVPDFFEAKGLADLPPATRFDVLQPPVEESVPEKLEIVEVRREVRETDPDDLKAIRGLDAGTILEFAENLPEIQGGMGALYLNIDYPEAARQQGIQGRVVLQFVVEKNGRVEHVDILESLHPLCDSAAVRALRRTAFVPGRQNGNRVRVRMSLPVRFRLVEPGSLGLDPRS